MSMVIRYLDFSKYHGKQPQGSTKIRVHQLIKYWPEADIYKYGEKVDVAIFQKVYSTPDWKWPEKLKAIKILDLCDPDYMHGMAEMKSMIDHMDAVTCSSQGLVDFFKQMTDKPVLLVRDRFDLEEIPPPKNHVGEAKKLVWFGYAHNAETLKPALPIIQELGVSLTVIADDDPIVHRWMGAGFKEKYTYIKHKDDTIYQELQKCDIAILPKGTRPQDKFKSENKRVRAMLAGLPVADDIASLKLFMDGEERQKFIDTNYAKIRQEYDVRKSVEEMKDLINEIANKRN